MKILFTANYTVRTQFFGSFVFSFEKLFQREQKWTLIATSISDFQIYWVIGPKSVFRKINKKINTIIHPIDPSLYLESKISIAAASSGNINRNNGVVKIFQRYLYRFEGMKISMCYTCIYIICVRVWTTKRDICPSSPYIVRPNGGGKMFLLVFSLQNCRVAAAICTL